MAIAIIRYLVLSVLSVFELILLVYCLSSFFIRDPFNKFISALNVIVDPVLQPLRWLLEKIPFLRGLPIDFSPLAAFLLCSLIRGLLL